MRHASYLCLALSVLLWVTDGDAQQEKPGDWPTIGAIRWDAWYGGPITDEVALALTPPQYHFRLPFFAHVSPEGAVSLPPGTPEIMEREIDFAAAAGLDYWAFVLYPEENSLSRGLALYLSSAARHRLRFCLILHNTLGVPAQEWPGETQRIVKLLQEPGYMHTAQGRPLLYMYMPQPFGPAVKSRLAMLQAALAAAGLKPYYVLMGWQPARDWQEAQALGFDAISAYARAAQGSYKALTEAVEQRLWEYAAAANIPLVPLATTGWDPRPRIDRPPPWQANAPSLPWAETATPEEIAAHLRQALLWTKAHSSLCPAQTVIVYAWNEHDEGGWLCPTWRADSQPDDSRLQAIQRMLAALRDTP